MEHLKISIIAFMAIIAISAATSSSIPYFPRTSDTIFNHLSGSSLRQECEANNFKVDFRQAQDSYKTLKSIPPTLGFAVVSGPGSAENRRSVMIICGLRGRHFISTEVCVQFVNKLCAGKIPDSSNTDYVVVPVVNAHSHDMLINLWPELRGMAARPWSEITSAVGTTNYRLIGEMAKGGIFKQRYEDSNTRAGANFDAIEERVFMCYDGSFHMTLLDQNFPHGWMERYAPDSARNTYVRHESSEMERACYDSLSINGRIAASDPETRILRNILVNGNQSFSLVIEVVQESVAGFLSPYESPVLSNIGEPDLRVQSVLDKSEARSISLASSHCPLAKCIGGVANVVRPDVMDFRSGTVCDLAIKNGAGAALVIQIGYISLESQQAELSDPLRGNVRALRDCLGPFVPHYDDSAKKMIDDWTTALSVASKKV